MAAIDTHPLISIKRTSTVQDAARRMADCSLGALGVVDDDHAFIGIVTERDLVWFLAQARDPVLTTVGEITNDFPVVVDGPLDATAAVERMQGAHVRHLIVREEGDLRIVSLRDCIAGPSPERPTVGAAGPETAA